MRALITGGKGFVGQWLAAHLKDRGDEVAVIDIETDVADGAAVRRVDGRRAARRRLPPGRDDPCGRELGRTPARSCGSTCSGTAEILAAARVARAQAPGSWS